ncbi:MAG TPA: response regulator transcription factor, partial [Candidatus Dormibacteraeota bacterium]|nr:response regulator transcription factor [Candidatus Dormibacteraeota bacterium]
LARLRAVQRRPRRGAASDLAVGDLRFDPSGHTATAGEVELIMTSRELAILELLMRRAPAIVERTAIAHHAWQDDAGPVGSNTIDVHLSHIRRKLADAGSDVELHTVRGLGYRLATP